MIVCQAGRGSSLFREAYLILDFLLTTNFFVLYFIQCNKK